MANKRFGDFVLGNGGGSESSGLEAKCLALYQSIYDGEVSESELDDFCSHLGNELFVEEVKQYFPVLRSDGDEHLHDSSSYTDRIRAAAKQHIPERYLSPAAHNEAVLLVRQYMHTIAYFVSGADLSPSVKTGLYLGFGKLFEVAGAATPGYVTDYLEGKEGSIDLVRHKVRVNRKSKDKSSLRQSLGAHTDTGVVNGGSTCYQNVVFRLLLSSEAVMSLVTAQDAVNVFLSAEKENDIDFHVFDLVLNIARKNFEGSKDRLRKFWEILAENSTSAGEQPWTTGRQQDPAELITKFFLQDLRISFLIPAWAHGLKTKDDCLACHRKTSKVDSNNLIYPLHLSSDKVSETPTSQDLDFVGLFNDSLTVPEIIEKNCQTCGENTFHSRATALVQDGERDASDHLPEIVVQLVRFDAAGRKVRQKVDLPSGLFALNGRHCLYYMKYVAVHIGSQLSQGHYFSFERPSLSEAAQQQSPEDESEQANIEPASKKFHKWTRYEDNRKTENHKFSDIESEYGKDTYLCRLVPARSGDIATLISMDEIIASVRSTIVDSCSDFRGDVSDALDMMNESTSEAIAESLRVVFRKVMQLSRAQKLQETISDKLLLQQLATTFRRELPTKARSNLHLSIFLDSWLMDEWKAYTNASQQSLSRSARVEDVANGVLRQMLTPDGIVDLITSLGRSVVDGNARRHEQENKKRLLNTEYEKIREQQQKQQARLAAAHAERAAEEEAARQREINLDGDDEDEANLQMGIQLSLLGQGDAPGTHGSDDATSSQLKALQQKHDELRKKYDELADKHMDVSKKYTNLQKAASKRDKPSGAGSNMPPPSAPKTGSGPRAGAGSTTGAGPKTGSVSKAGSGSKTGPVKSTITPDSGASAGQIKKRSAEKAPTKGASTKVSRTGSPPPRKTSGVKEVVPKAKSTSDLRSKPPPRMNLQPLQKTGTTSKTGSDEDLRDVAAPAMQYMKSVENMRSQGQEPSPSASQSEPHTPSRQTRHTDLAHRPSPRRPREDSHPRMPHPEARVGSQSPYPATASGSPRRGKRGKLMKGLRPDRERSSSPQQIGQGTSKDPLRFDGPADEPNIPSDDGRTDEPSVSSRVAPSKDQSISSRGDEKSGYGKPGESNTIRQKLKSTFSILDLRKSRRRNRLSTSKQRVTSGLFRQPEESSTSGNLAPAIPRRESKGDLMSKTDAPEQPNTIRRSQSFLNLFGRSEKQAKSMATTAQVEAGNLQSTLQPAQIAQGGTPSAQTALQPASTAQGVDSSTQTQTSQQPAAETGTRRVPFRERPISSATVIHHQLSLGQSPAENDKDKDVEMKDDEGDW
ncbi:hypothetical protein Q7P37_000190 [Cladosporium fusiforme]